jgi:DMSO/TMAO reductase YedYZ heme-binding membrane subunit
VQLGKVLYRGYCIGSGLLVALALVGAAINLGNENWHAIARVLAVAAFVYATGRTVLYVSRQQEGTDNE